MEKKGKSENALIAFNKAIKINPNNPNNVKVYNELGQLLKRTGKLEGAVQAYKNAIRLNPQYPFSYYNIAGFFEESGKKEEAIAFYEKFIQFAKDDYPEEVEKIRAKIERGLVPDASEMAQRIKSQKNLSAKELFSNAKKAQGAEKIVLLKKAVNADPNFFVANYELANCYREFGNIKKAVETYKEVIQKAPKFAMAYNDIGEIYLEHGNLELAKKLFLKVLSINPDHPKSKANLKKMGIEPPKQNNNTLEDS